MNDLQTRSILYGGGVAAVAALVIAWSRVDSEADVMTLLSSADVQLRMAYAIPAQDKQGKPLSARQDMITTAEEHLAIVERIQPGLAVTAEFEGFAHMLRGSYVAAASSYRRARQCADVQEEQHDILLFNEARMLAKAGRGEEALEVFQSRGEVLDRRFGPQRALEEATILRELGRPDRAKARLEGARGHDAATSMTSLQAGIEYQALGDDAAAERAFTTASLDLPIGDYHLARLKLRTGDVDSSFALLERAERAIPTEVRRLLREEQEAWSAVASDARLQRLLVSEPAAPGR